MHPRLVQGTANGVHLLYIGIDMKSHKGGPAITEGRLASESELAGQVTR